MSGAYSVLYGAPAIVSAVDRYVTADRSRPASFVTPEVRAALGRRGAPWFDATELRAHERKLGLGSSAAILVASLAAHHAQTEPSFVERVLWPAALRAHERAQGGGSGADVTAACFGGTLEIERSERGITQAPLNLPDELVIEVWSSAKPSSTAAFIRAVRELERDDRGRHATLIDALAQAAGDTVEAAHACRAQGVLDGLRRQLAGLEALGRACSIPIVTDAVQRLGQLAAEHGALVLPAGAGGGDIAYYVGLEPPPASVRARLCDFEHEPLELELGARGVHGLSETLPPAASAQRL